MPTLEVPVVNFGALWLPILLSAVLAWIASAIAWTASPHHKSDFRGVSDEDSLLNELRKQNLKPGQYWFPFYTNPKDADKPEIAQKLEKGPVVLTVWPPGKPAMGKSMILSLVFNLVVSFMVAYVVGRTLGPGTAYLSVFRVAATVAFLAYSFALLPDAIWFGTPWRRTWKSFADGLVYGLLTGGVFGWLWPA
jgi:hypothetical protein